MKCIVDLFIFNIATVILFNNIVRGSDWNQYEQEKYGFNFMRYIPTMMRKVRALLCFAWWVYV